MSSQHALRPSHCKEGIDCIPYNRREDGSGGGNLADIGDVAGRVADQRGSGNPASEPEDAGQGLDGQDAELVGSCREEERRNDEVGEGDNGPDGVEQDEVHLARRPPRGPVVHDWRNHVSEAAPVTVCHAMSLTIADQAQDDEGEHALRNSKRKRVCESHG